jgi:AcrR family transcriptional regulator
VPRNRRPQDREEKRSEIVLAAERLFTGDGYERTSMTQIAAAAGVTTTTIYWYFKDKDDLLVAVLDHLLASAVHDLDGLGGLGLTDQVLWAVERLDRLRTLVTVVHSRTTVSERVDTWHTDFHALVETVLGNALREAGSPEAEIGALTRVGVFVVEGLLSHPLGEADKRAAIEMVTARA